MSVLSVPINDCLVLRCICCLQMLYILRPLIYAALVQQIEAYRAKQSADGVQSTTSSSTGDSSAASSGTATNMNSGSAGYSGTFRKVLDAFTMDALLGVVALAISFVSTIGQCLFICLFTCFICLLPWLALAECHGLCLHSSVHNRHSF